jgi:hypothetical protein
MGNFSPRVAIELSIAYYHAPFGEKTAQNTKKKKLLDYAAKFGKKVVDVEVSINSQSSC